MKRCRLREIHYVAVVVQPGAVIRLPFNHQRGGLIELGMSLLGMSLRGSGLVAGGFAIGELVGATWVGATWVELLPGGHGLATAVEVGEVEPDRPPTPPVSGFPAPTLLDELVPGAVEEPLEFVTAPVLLGPLGMVVLSHGPTMLAEAPGAVTCGVVALTPPLPVTLPEPSDTAGLPGVVVGTPCVVAGVFCIVVGTLLSVPGGTVVPVPRVCAAAIPKVSISTNPANKFLRIGSPHC
jgi:hypothetical protein